MARGPDYYRTLGVDRKATHEEIKRAYRRLALNIHPDRSSAPDATERFTRLTEAYEVLGDPRARYEYDQQLAREERPVVPPVPPAPKPQPKPKAKSEPRPKVQKVAPRVASAPRGPTPDLARLAALFSRGKLEEAEMLAERIIDNFPREALPYAVLGDIARARGDMPKASKLYAFAVQMDPRNAAYQHRYEELLQRMGVRQDVHPPQPMAAVAGAFGVALLASIYVVVAKERPAFRDLPIVSTWTVGLLVMLFLSGVATGVSFALARMLDRFSAVSVTALGRLSPAVALATVAIVNFWAAVVLYIFLGLTQQSLNYSTSRFMAACAGVLMILTMGASLGGIDAGQTLLWGGNVLYLGGLSGWMVGDALRRA